MKRLCSLVCVVFTLPVVLALPQRHTRQLELDTYDSNNYDIYIGSDYDHGVTIEDPQIGTFASAEDSYQPTLASLEAEEEEEEKPLQTLELTVSSGGSGVPEGGMSTCVLCTCAGGSVYCDNVKLERIPPLAKDTTHFYARYNNIKQIHKSDFAHMNKMKRIDLSSNLISQIDADAFLGLPALEELMLRENWLVQLPPLPTTMTLIDASNNQLGSNSIQKEAFKDMNHLLYLFLSDNNIGHIPVPLPQSLRSLHLQNNNIQMMHEDTFCNLLDLHYIRHALEDVRLDGNPINLSLTSQAYVCLPRLPIGRVV